MEGVPGVGDEVEKTYTCDVCGLTETVKCHEWAIASFHQIKITNNQKVIDTFGKDEFNICALCYIKNLGVKPK